MGNLKLKMQIIDEDKKVIGSSIIECKAITELSEKHNIDMLKHEYIMMLQDIDDYNRLFKSK